MPDRREIGRAQTERLEPTFLTSSANRGIPGVSLPPASALDSSEAMLPTVRDILHLPVMSDALAEVVAGHDRLDTPVRWAHVNETLEAAKLLNGGELLLTTGVAWDARPARLESYIDELVRVGVAGLVVELGKKLAVVPPALSARCAARGLPLIVLHHEIKFVSVTEAVHVRIIADQTEALHARDELHTLFTGLSLRGSPADYIVRQIAHVLRSPVVLENLAHEVIASEGADEASGRTLSEWQTSSRAAHRGEREGWLVVPVEARGMRWGALVALPGEPHAAGRLAVLQQGAVALAIARLADGGADEWVRVAQQNLIDALIGRRFSTKSGIRARLEAAGLPVAGRALVGLTVSVRPRGKPAAAPAAFASEGLRSDAAKKAATAIGASAVAGLGAAASARLVVCLSIAEATLLDDHRLERFARAYAEAAGVSANELVIGVGTVAPGLGGLLLSLQEAMELRVVDAARNGLVIQRSENRPLLRLVTALRDDPRMQEHSQEMLRPLIDYDERRGGDLMAVLAAVLTHPTSRTAAAAASHLSRSVFYQRLTTISELLGADLEDGETLAALHVALLAR